ncbi:hypothetical protein ACINWC323_3545 [Acinetobacter sp. WC-323]|uniref:DUF4870 family protein n=1 Tax=Acinetobacter sp. WC-323 TaxID=903918 RepID=UPI00029DD7B3|nr:hypothetical protein [Acinetobacter sp. WC-323]EKU60529.1 hypothetical protein ACINWC323_3545 [Acinetobacter sp. WC-323]
MNHTVDQQAYRGLTYVLYVFYLISGFTGSVLAFVALALNYIKRKEVKGTVLDSHFSWQIRTFWWCCLWNLLSLAVFALALFHQELGIPFSDDHASSAFFIGLAFLFAAWAWTVYRSLHGLFCLYDNKPMYE